MSCLDRVPLSVSIEDQSPEEYSRVVMYLIENYTAFELAKGFANSMSGHDYEKILKETI